MGNKNWRLILLNLIPGILLLMGSVLFVVYGHRYSVWSSILPVSLIFISTACLYFFNFDLKIKGIFLKNLVDWSVLLILIAILLAGLSKLENYYLNNKIQQGSLSSTGRVIRVGHLTYKSSTGPRFVIIKYFANGHYYLQKSFNDTLNVGDELKLNCAAADPSIVEISERIH